MKCTYGKLAKKLNDGRQVFVILKEEEIYVDENGGAKFFLTQKEAYDFILGKKLTFCSVYLSAYRI